MEKQPRLPWAGIIMSLIVALFIWAMIPSSKQDHALKSATLEFKPIPAASAIESKRPARAINQFVATPNMMGLVIKSEPADIDDYYWVTFVRYSDRLAVTGLSRINIPVGTRVHLVETQTQLMAGAALTQMAIVLRSM